LTFLVAPEFLKESFHFDCLLPLGGSRNSLRLFALLLPSVDTFEKLLNKALEFCLIVLSRGQVAEFVDRLLDFDGHPMRLMRCETAGSSSTGFTVLGGFCGMYLGEKRLSMSRESLELGDLCFDCVLILL
jgi:hypothetical protein